ncbi:MAG: cupin domain-containing protein [bacterium]
MRILLLGIFLLFGSLSCGRKTPPGRETPPVNPGLPQHWDVGDWIRRKPLPADVADGYLQLGTSPHSGYGVILAHQRLSARHHVFSDLIIYVHTGIARFHIGDRSFTVSPGDLVYIPRGYVYSAESLSKQPLELVSIYTPPLNPDDIVYHEAAERVIPTPSGKKLRVILSDTAQPPPTPPQDEDKEFMEMEEHIELNPNE